METWGAVFLGLILLGVAVALIVWDLRNEREEIAEHTETPDSD